MTPNALRTVVRHLRRRAGEGDAASCVDADLVTRFAERLDEAAFEEIVRRHGPLVWALCRSALQTSDAEDAFQATFVVLARRAAYIRKPASLACWLSGVTRRVIRQARRKSAHRPTAYLSGHELANAADRQQDRSDWREVLDEELHRLPEKYRLPLVLCYYQGLTNEEAASRLGWRHGTVCGRLARARRILRSRLARRGLTLSLGALATHGVALPSGLLAATFRVAAETATRGRMAGNLAGHLLDLSSGVIQTMWHEKLRAWVVGTTAAVVLTGTGLVLVPAIGQTPQPMAPMQPPMGAIPVPPQAAARADPQAIVAEMDRVLADLAKATPPLPVTPADGDIPKLRWACYRSAVDETTARLKAFTAGTTQGTIDILLGCVVRRLLPAELALRDRPRDRLTAYQRALEILKLIESVNDVRFRAGRIAVQDLEQSRYERLSMEIKVLEAKSLAGGAAKP